MQPSVWIFCLLLLLLAWIVLYKLAGQTYAREVRTNADRFKLARLAPPMLYVLERLRPTERYPLLLFKIQRSIQTLYGSANAQALTPFFLAEWLNYSYLSLVSGCAVSLLTDGEAAGFALGAVMAVLIPAAMIQDLAKKVVRRQQDIVLELPELLNKITLLVNAGETVQKALAQCVERKQEHADHPLYKELIQMINEWRNGYSFQQSFEQFSKRCAVQEVSIFATTILLNHRRGGDEFVTALRDLSRLLWEKRKAISRTRGEEASSKLVFPMVVIFFVLLALVCTPIFLMMN